MVGVGVNCAQAPEGLGYPTTCLTRANGMAVSPGDLFERLAQRFDETLSAWRAGEAFESIRAAWLDCALGLGGPIVVENGGVKRQGVFEGIDANGRLLIRSGRGLETVEAADLRILPASDAAPRADSSDSRAGEGRV